MSHFYGVVDGKVQKHQATRRGFKNHGLTTTAASWEGAVRVYLYYNEAQEEDWAEVVLAPWHGKGRHLTVYHGPVSGAGVELEKIAQAKESGVHDVN